MKQLVFIIAFLTTSFVVAQDKFTATFDYEVDYEIVGGIKGKDTIKVAFDKAGRYVWTNYAKLANDYTFINQEYLPKFSANIIYDVKQDKVYMQLNNKEYSFFFKMSLANILPKGSGFSESFDMIAAKTSNMTSIMGKQYPYYKIYPSNKTAENDKINVVFDETYPIDNNSVFQGFIDILSDKKNNNTIIGLDLPKGLILQVASPSPKEEVFFKAIAVKKISRTITINNTLEIKE